MKKKSSIIKPSGLIPWTIRSILLGLAVGPVIFFLTRTVEVATKLRNTYPWLILGIPLGALITAILYEKLGHYLKDGNNQVINLINQGIIDIAHPTSIGYKGDQENHSNRISTKMAPLLFLNTFITHLVGASGGKEGVGVQVGASIGSYLGCFEAHFFPKRSIKLQSHHREVWLISGAGAAFGALFNAPIAGTLFGLQFSSPRVNRTDALLPCFISSTTACLISQAMNIHTLKPLKAEAFGLDAENMVVLIVLALIFGLTSKLFCYLIHLTKLILKTITTNPIKQVLIPSFLLLGLSLGIYIATGSFQYNGMSTGLITQAALGTSSKVAPLLKLLLTTLTIGCGFAGGEVIPIMVIGATTGALFAPFCSIPLSSMVMLGAIGMLSGATKLPLACFILGLELFGYGNPLSLFLVCCIAYIASGKTGIYEKQIAPVSIDETWEV
jgi:H+/Cl- antiporter ClcA